MQKLINLLEERFYNVAYGDEKQYILSLLSLYYPIMQQQIKIKTELKQSKMNFYKLEKECMHNEPTKDKHSRYIYKCAKCNKVILK